MRHTKQLPAVLTLRRAAAMLGVGVGTVKALIDAGLLQAVKLSAPESERRHVRVLRQSVERLLREENGHAA